MAIAPRRTRIYVARTLYALVMLILMSTAWLILTGTQVVRDVGDLARFGTILFQIFAPLQLALGVFFSAVLTASAVAQEKDRRTLDLLLITRLSNSELVLGKLLASLLMVGVLLGTSLPLFAIILLFGGVSPGQVVRVYAVTAAAALVSGSLGSTLALWREKTFQSVAMTLLVLVLWLAIWEVVARDASGEAWGGLTSQTWAIGFSPWQAILEAARPYPAVDPALGVLGAPANLFLLVSVSLAVLLNGAAIALVRYWNPSREAHAFVREDETWHRQSIWGAEQEVAGESGLASVAPSAGSELVRSAQSTRRVWDNPILWREICTWAYGRKIVLIRLAYLAFFVMVAGGLLWFLPAGGAMAWSDASLALVPLFLLSLVLVNAQAVTSLTSERDSRAIDLLLVSDLTPKEFVYGKLGGVLYNTKEMILLPLLLCFGLWCQGGLDLEVLVYLVLGLTVLYLFVAMLGVHAGMMYANSRSAIATSLGTVFFLFVGVATCMRMMVAFSGSFEAQLPFLGLLILGGAGLYLALGVRNPSTAIGLASFLCPLATFYAITSFFLSQPHLVFVAMVAAYGFTTVAMLIPAVDEFDVATGRTTVDE
jgi:ABC-type transport system involved in multi-copper enzyme maturation permease subunit